MLSVAVRQAVVTGLPAQFLSDLGVPRNLVVPILDAITPSPSVASTLGMTDAQLHSLRQIMRVAGSERLDGPQAPTLGDFYQTGVRGAVYAGRLGDFPDSLLLAQLPARLVAYYNDGRVNFGDRYTYCSLLPAAEVVHILELVGLKVCGIPVVFGYLRQPLGDKLCLINCSTHHQ